MKSIAFAAVILLIGIQGALALRCYECVPVFHNTSNFLEILSRSESKNICGKPTKAIDCPVNHSCSIMKMTGRKAGIGDFTVSTLNCSYSYCANVTATKIMACPRMKAITDLAGAELVNCEVNCCQDDLCNKPVFPSTSPADFPPNCAIFGILGVIYHAFMNIY
ncbi:hypothetical protein ACROYT_G016497 [Oculina patagonica]